MSDYLHEQLEVVSSFLGITAADIEKSCPIGLTLPDLAPTTRQLASFRRTAAVRPDGLNVSCERIILAALEQLPFYSLNTVLAAWMEFVAYYGLASKDVVSFDSPRLIGMQAMFRTAWVIMLYTLVCSPR